MKFRDEDSFVQDLCAQWPANKSIHTGPGDDCALLQSDLKGWLDVIKTDAVVQEVHFTMQMLPRQIGRKALARVLSDFAAMGATPTAAVVAVGIPSEDLFPFIKKTYQGMASLAAQYNVALLGGETTQSAQLTFCVSAIGKVKAPKAVLRSTAKESDLIYVTGKLGGSFPKRHLTFTPRLAEGQWLAAHGFASAMMDLSDGLGKDLPRLAKASSLSFEIEPSALPLNAGSSAENALNDGEDYELLFTVPVKYAKRLEEKWPFKTKLTCVGRMLPKGAPNITGGLKINGFDHLKILHNKKRKK